MISEVLVVTGIHLLGAASPGPDFALVLKNSIRGGSRGGVMTALGIATGIIFHVAYSIFGLALVISQSIVAFNTVKLVGAGYLIWIGIKSLKSKKSEDMDLFTATHIAPFKAFQQGFLTNMLNPKVTLFFLSLFTQILDPATPALEKSVYGFAMVLSTFAWFSFVALALTRQPVLRLFEKNSSTIDQMFGLILIVIGISVALRT